MAAIDISENEIGEDRLYERIAGRLVEAPRMWAWESCVASFLHEEMATFSRERGLGRVVIGMLFALDETAGLARRPEVAFVSYDRWPRGRRIPREAAWDVIPDLAVEVIGPVDKAAEILQKTLDYLRAGVRRVWVIYPIQGQVHIHDTTGVIRVLKLEAGDSLDGEEIFPGFTMPLATLFEADAAD